MLVAALTTSAAATAVTPATAAASSGYGYGQAELQHDVDVIRDTGVTGVQARLTTTDGADLVAASGVADLETEAPVPADGYYRIGSNGKTFVAAVALQLVGEGKLSLDDLIEAHLPGVVQGNGNDGRKVTVRHLLQHTSGLYSYTNDLAPVLFASYQDYLTHRYDRFRPKELVAMAMRHPPNFAPGTGWSYSNTGYLLVGLIIEKLTGNPWDEEVTDRIITPLGLEDTSAGNPPEVPDPHAKGYQQFAPGEPLQDVTVFDPSWGGPAGDVISTTADLDRFFRALLGGELLRPDLLAEMQTTVAATEFQDELTPGYRYGLGLAWNPLPCGGGYWHHGGDTPGYHSREGFTTDGRRGVVISSSTQQADEEPAAQQTIATLRLIENALCATPG